MSLLLKIDGNGIVSYNKENFLKEPKIFLSDGKVRIQASILNNDREIPIDLVIYQYSFAKPSIVDIMCLKGHVDIYFNGVELKSKTEFDMSIKYQIGKSLPYLFEGICGNVKIHQSFETMMDVYIYFAKLFNLN